MVNETCRILLVDAEEETCKELTESLYDRGNFLVDTAHDSEDAWELIQRCEEPYQVIMIDELLPEPYAVLKKRIGINLAREMKKYDPGVEIIVFSSKENERNLEEALWAGAFRYLDKSYDRDELAVLIRYAAEQQKLEGEARQKAILERLLETNAKLLSAETEQEVFDAVLPGIQALNFDRVRLYLLAEDGQSMHGKAHVGMDESFYALIRHVADDKDMQDLLADPRPHVRRRAQGERIPFEDQLDKDGVEEWVCLPLLQKSKVIGALSADNKFCPRPIREDELGPVTLFASQAAAAITNVRLLAETKQQAEQLEALRNTALAMTSQRELEPLLKTIIAGAVQLLKTKGGGIYKYHKERDILELIIDYSRPHFVGRILQVGEGMAGRLLQSHKPYMIVDDYPHWEGRAEPRRTDVKLFGALLGIPLQWQGQVLGVLLLGDDFGRKFTQEDARLLRLFGDQAAISLYNAELLTQDAAKVKRLEKLSKATKDIADNLGATTSKERLKLIARHVVDILDAEVSGVLLVQPSSGLLRLEAGYGHRAGSFEEGKEYPIRRGERLGLTSYIAHEGKPFRKYGNKLKNHWASDREVPDHLPSGDRCSFLVIPLKKRVGQEEQLIGLIRAENKKGTDGKPHWKIGFSEEDEWILNIFAEAAVVAIESTKLFQEAKAAHARLQASFQASSTLLSSQSPGEVLQDIVEQARMAADADRARGNLIRRKGTGSRHCRSRPGAV